MTCDRRMVGAGVAALVLGTALLWTDAAAQSRAEGRSGSLAARADIPRTADGKPDLQGVFSFATATPLQRPADLADKPVLTEAEAAAYARQQAARRSESDTNRRDGSVGMFGILRGARMDEKQD